MNCSTCGGSIGDSPAVGQRHYSSLGCLDVMRIEMNSLKLQNRRLKESIWKHLHIKHERTICPLSVGTPERCCEIIMKDAGLNPANGEPIEKCAADQHDWKPIPITFEGWDAECRKCGDKKEI